MKTLKITLLATIGLFSSLASAADLYVRDLGAGGAYSTISAAITAAVDGDRIIVRPKIGNAPYLESLTINKSLTFLSETNFSKYYVQGTISIVPAVGRTVTINNMYAYQSSISTSITTLSGGRATINLINCIADNNFDLDNTGRVTANVFKSECNALYFVHGKITGNKLKNLFLNEDVAPLATSDVAVIGNNVFYGTSFNTTSYAFTASNNDFCYDGSLESNASQATNLYGLQIENMKIGTTNKVLNNRIYNETSGLSNTSTKYAAVYCTAMQSAILYVANNIIVNLSVNTGQDYAITAFNATPTVVAINNFSTKSMLTSAVDTETGTITNGTYTFDFTNNVSTGGIVNTGIADDEYADIDLTRNDIGLFGGSDSWSNYWPIGAGNKPRVTYLSTPRRVYNGTTTMPVEAVGISK